MNVKCPPLSQAAGGLSGGGHCGTEKCSTGGCACRPSTVQCQKRWDAPGRCRWAGACPVFWAQHLGVLNSVPWARASTPAWHRNVFSFVNPPHLAAGIPAKLFLGPPHALARAHTHVCAASASEPFPPAQRERSCSAQGCRGCPWGVPSVCGALGFGSSAPACRALAVVLQGAQTPPGPLLASAGRAVAVGPSD